LKPGQSFSPVGPWRSSIPNCQSLLCQLGFHQGCHLARHDWIFLPVMKGYILVSKDKVRFPPTHPFQVGLALKGKSPFQPAHPPILEKLKDDQSDLSGPTVQSDFSMNRLFQRDCWARGRPTKRAASLHLNRFS
jgi:hypothetical protein